MTLGRENSSKPPVAPASYGKPAYRDAVSVAPKPTSDAVRAPRLAELLIPLTPAIDAAEGLPQAHAMRTALTAVKLGNAIGLERTALRDVYFAALLKDLGATSARSVAAHTYGPGINGFYHALHHADLTTLRGSFALAWPLLRASTSWRGRVAGFVDILIGQARGPMAIERRRSRTGASIALEMGFNRGTAEAILSQNERWDGRSRPEAYAGDAISLYGRVLNTSQAVVSAWFEGGAGHAVGELKRLSGNRLDPSLVEHSLRLLEDERFVEQLGAHDIETLLLEVEPDGYGYASASRVDRLFTGFGRFIDAKSPWTYRHSERVRELAVGAAVQLDRPYHLGATAMRRLKRAALLHDVALLATPSEVLDSRKSFSDTELELLRSTHPISKETIVRVLDLADLAPVTETYTGTEPPSLLDAPGSTLSAQQREELTAILLGLADKFEALTAPRPHRERRSFDDALGALRSEAEKAGAMHRAALVGLERFLATPTAAAVLAPRTFDPNAIVVVE